MMKTNNLDVGTFGDPTKIKALIGLKDMMNKMDPKDCRHISRVIGRFNTRIKELGSSSQFKDKHFFMYIVQLVRNDYKNKVDEIRPRYAPNFITHLENYICAIFRKLENEKIPEGIL